MESSMSMQAVNMKAGSKVDYNKLADIEQVPTYVQKNMLELVGEDPDILGNMKLADIHDYYIQFWHSLSFKDKKKNAVKFKNIHHWVMKTRGKYNIYPYQRPQESGLDEHICKTCNGSGLFVYTKKTYMKTVCPSCNGTKKHTVICHNCDGYGCDVCDGTGKLIDKNKFCSVCSIETPFGEIEGSGYVFRKFGEVGSPQICKSCMGTGQVKD